MLGGRSVWLDKFVAYWGALLLPFLSLSPVTDFTQVGNALRGFTLVLLVIFFAARVQKSLNLLTDAEKLFFLYVLAVGIVSTIAGAVAGRHVELEMTVKFFLLQPMIFLVARSFTSTPSICNVFYLYYLLCLLASLQGIAATGAEFLGLRQLGEIPIDDGRADYKYNLSWFGLLGGDVGNGRTNFYFSEATHFAHFLFPGIAYAVGTKRYIGFVLLMGGFATTFSGAASLALIGFLVTWLIRGSDIRGVVVTVLVFLVGWCMIDVYVNLDDGFYERMFDRAHSVEDKTLTYLIALKELFEHPFGVGVFNTPAFYGGLVNTSGGLFNWIVWFGWLSFPAILTLLWSLIKCSFNRSGDPLLTMMSLGMFFLAIGTFSHGPLPKYFMIFFIGLLFQYRALRLTTRHPGAASAVHTSRRLRNA